jgi:hypothetical protein
MLIAFVIIVYSLPIGQFVLLKAHPLINNYVTKLS